jgi:hypothetical protein
VEQHGIPGEPKTLSKRQIWRRQLVWIIPFCLVFAAFTVHWLLLGARGVEVANVVGPLVTVLSVFLGFHLTVVVEDRLSAAGPGWLRSLDRKARKRLVAVASTSVVVVVLAGFTGRVHLQNADSVAPSAAALVLFPPRLPQRERLSVLPVLENRALLGDCVDPATLDVVALVDGQARSTRTTTSGSAVDLVVGHVDHDLRLTVKVRQQDPECVVALRLTSAVLHD